MNTNAGFVAGAPAMETDMGDMFVSGFNTGNYHTSWSTGMDKATPPGQMPFGFETVASSPEQTNPFSPQDSLGRSNSAAGANGDGDKSNPRSCVTCRRRKVRCDKKEPKCSNCGKANIDCIYPPPGRAPRKPRRPQDAELLKRLRRLESVVDSLGAQVDEDGHVHENEGRAERRNTASDEILESLTNGANRRTSLEQGVGKLMLKDGRSRYVTNEFYATLGREIVDIKNECLDSASSDDEVPHSPGDTTSTQKKYQHHQGFMFGYSSLLYDMTKLSPNPSQIFIIWEVYKENVDPILKILHIPTVKNVIMKAAVSANKLSKAAEALFYSICFASVVSMKEDQCQQLLGEPKDTLTDKYRFAIEQALARAQFLNSTNLMVLQAFAMFITVVKFNDTSRSIWCLAALALQQAQSQGLHRDPTNFRIPPFETEMRRRLWWHIYLQDARAAEDYGADPSSHQFFFDTKMPLNVNDDELWPEMTETPNEQAGASDMTFCLVRFELANMQRKLRLLASAESDDEKKESIKSKEKLIDAEHQRMQETYFRYCDPSSPILWVASTVGKLILAKMWLFIHHPRLFQEDHSQSADDLREQVFCTSVEVIEFGSLLEKGKHTSKWSWLFHTYNQWHAVAYVLSELCQRPMGPEFERAWIAVEAVYDKRMLEFPKSQRGVLWRPLRQLYTRAKKRRAQLTNSNSPHSEPDTNKSVSTDALSQGNLTPSLGLMNEHWLSNNPYVSAVATSGDAFNIDFNDPSLNDINMSNFNFNLPGNPSSLPLKTPLDAIPFGWNPGMSDYFNDFSMQPQQTSWTPQMQQEWH